MTPQFRHRYAVGLSRIVLTAMLAITTYASLDRNIFNLGDQLVRDPWFLATLCDAYCGFLIFYLWVAYKEESAVGRAVWFVVIMALGNIATATYLLRELWRTRRSKEFNEFLLKRTSTAP